MKLGKIIKLIFSLLLSFFFFKEATFANENRFVTIVNPVRGDEFFDSKTVDILSGVKLQKGLIDKSRLKATWLLRFDSINSEEMSSYFKNNFNDQELGIFMEVTLSQSRQVEVSYPQGGLFWHDANKIFLSGYKPEERVKLIDGIFSRFKETFGYYPRSVGAWHIDAFSAEYMRRKYGVTGVLICTDQYGTDGYQIWGGWWGVPYYPSKFNILVPAQTLKNKIDVVVFWWAARDPKLGYGGSVEESTYSVQVNDYLRHSLGIDYFKKLMDVYLTNKENLFNQLTVGLENDADWQAFSDGYDKQLEEIGRRKKNKEIDSLTMKDFSSWYKNRFLGMSPDHQIGNWYMSTSFRVGLSEIRGRKVIRDLRIYNEAWPEANLLTANPWGTLSLNNPYKIDTVRFDNSAVKADFKINRENLIKKFGGQKIPFKVSTPTLLVCYLVILLGTTFLIKNVPLVFLILVGSVALSIPMVKSGLVYPFGMGFWGPNGHDGIWHIALINQLAKFSLENPVFAGSSLTNYHFGFDLLAAFLSRLTGIIPVNIYFQILPPVMAILIGILTFKFVEKWTLSKKAGWWATFFVYFGGSWGWLVSLLRYGKLGGESTFWANQAVSTLINPPYALSLIVLLLGLIKLLDYLKKPNKKNLFICAFLLGILIQIKVYAGVIVFGSLACSWLATLIFYRVKAKEFFCLFLSTLFIAAAVFLPFNLKATSLLVFSPLWFPRTMIAYSDRLGWFKLENARLAYFHSGKWLKWLLAEGLALTIFILGNLGTRIVGVCYGGFWWRRKRKVSEIELLLLFSLGISLVLPLLFIQKGNPWNTIQFFYYFQFLMAIFAGVVIGGLFEKLGKCRINNILIYFTTVLLAVLTLPTTISTLKNDYLPSRPPSRVSIEELEALKFLSEQSEGIVLTYPHSFDWHSKFSEPKPLYAYETTACVSALGSKQTYLEDEMNLEIMGYDWLPRREQSQRFFITADQKWGRNFLLDNKIKYIYLVKGQKMNLGLGDINGEKIFENGETVIYRIK